MFKNFRSREHNFQIKSAEIDSQLKDIHSVKYFRFGFINRFYMVQFARNELIAIINKLNQDPPDHIVDIKMKLFLNSLYINLSGALDNLAWFLNYHYGLQDIIVEESGKNSSRKFTDLFGKNFLEALKTKNSIMSDSLLIYKDWYKELKKLRDPSAHRIPLGFLQSWLDDEDRQESERIQNEITKNFEKFVKEGDIKKIEDDTKLINSLNKLGVFIPTIFTSKGANIQVRSAPEQLDKDYENFLSISEIVFKNF